MNVTSVSFEPLALYIYKDDEEKIVWLSFHNTICDSTGICHECKLINF